MSFWATRPASIVQSSEPYIASCFYDEGHLLGRDALHAPLRDQGA
jgi:hypothetical protein